MGSSIAGYGAFDAFIQTNPAIVTAVFKLSMLFTILWGAIFFQEKQIKQRFIAGVVMLIGALLLII